MTFKQGGIIMPHLLHHGASVFEVSSEGPPYLNHLKQARDTEDLFWPRFSQNKCENVFEKLLVHIIIKKKYFLQKWFTLDTGAVYITGQVPSTGFLWHCWTGLVTLCSLSPMLTESIPAPTFSPILQTCISET